MKYFYEKDLSKQGYRIGYENKKKLYSKKNKHHKIDVFENAKLGKILALDGNIKVIENYEFIYNEFMAHIPLFSHPNPSRVLIIGGGDGGILKEVLKHEKLKEICLVEEDDNLFKVSKKYFKVLELSSSEKDERLKIIKEDILLFLEKYENYFDIVIFDKSNIENIDTSFCKLVHKTLNKEGMFIMKVGSFFEQAKEIKQLNKKFKNVFNNVKTLRTISFEDNCDLGIIFASKKVSLEFNVRTLDIRFKQFKKNSKLRYYSPEIHMSSMVIPKFYED